MGPQYQTEFREQRGGKSETIPARTSASRIQIKKLRSRRLIDGRRNPEITPSISLASPAISAAGISSRLASPRLPTPSNRPTTGSAAPNGSSFIRPNTFHPPPPSFLREFMAACRCRSASASPPAMLSRAASCAAARRRRRRLARHRPLRRGHGPPSPAIHPVGDGWRGRHRPRHGRGRRRGLHGNFLHVCRRHPPLHRRVVRGASRRTGQPPSCASRVSQSASSPAMTCLPLDSLRTISTVSPFLMLISPFDWPAKSQMARHIGSCPAGGAAGGGGGGARIAGPSIPCADPFKPACGLGTARSLLPGRTCAAGREASFVGPPRGPPGRKSFPLVIGRPATGLGRGVGFDTELGDIPSLACIVLLL